LIEVGGAIFREQKGEHFALLRKRKKEDTGKGQERRNHLPREKDRIRKDRVGGEGQTVPAKVGREASGMHRGRIRGK